MKTARELEIEIEQKFGKDFITKKQELEELERELEQARDLENKIREKESELQKEFVHISDDYNIYPAEICEQFLTRLATECVERDYNKDDEQVRLKELQLEALQLIKSDAEDILEKVDTEIARFKE